MGARISTHGAWADIASPKNKPTTGKFGRKVYGDNDKTWQIARKQQDDRASVSSDRRVWYKGKSARRRTCKICQSH